MGNPCDGRSEIRVSVWGDQDSDEQCCKVLNRPECALGSLWRANARILRQELCGWAFSGVWGLGVEGESGGVENFVRAGHLGGEWQPVLPRGIRTIGQESGGPECLQVTCRTISGRGRDHQDGWNETSPSYPGGWAIDPAELEFEPDRRARSACPGAQLRHGRYNTGYRDGADRSTSRPGR
ncbi:hypothetical protein VUR80DRAFT_9238 [Thermomyces stellatus]